ncbi:pimeloyl-ACP methyl ester carboxylesterase [Georgenia soli]|uniref:Pimeloyl-ACP methyl ester carboxylesterase n=1 Tax=Georgenia soli TaxID=638953 RepID=A0A2A9EPL2_9MICO|nr:alpha/beta fold hydrolase [Georgenia soli]PFG40894.1 pimeloyl-ACP methyl ester carboxylesterase [Georgenia soli]
MTTFAVVHGAGGSAWEWHLVGDELAARGHRMVAVDLPCEDESAGLAEHADAVVTAIREADGAAGGPVVLVAHSLGGFVAPLVAARTPVRRLVLVSAMVPAPGETAGEWWETSGYRAAARERDASRQDSNVPGDNPGVQDSTGRQDGTADEAAHDPDAELVALFMHDVDRELAAEALRRSRDPAERLMSDPWPLPGWPDVPTSFLALGDDRVFPPSFLRAHARERLGVTADEMPGSHCAYLSRPGELAERLVGYAALDRPSRR